MGPFYYLLEVNLYLLIFFCFYRLMLQNETFYSLNRIYLIFTTIIAFLLPFFQVSALSPAEPEYQIVYTISTIEQPAQTFNTQPEFWTVPEILTFIYICISFILLLRFALKLYNILRMINRSTCERSGAVNILPVKGSNAYSFFNYLFIDPNAVNMDTVVKHEMAHIRQRHSMDILFFEIVHIINWINPLSRILKREIKAVHEFIADQNTIAYDTDRETYAKFLISVASDDAQSSLGSHLSGKHLLQERIIRLYKHRSAAHARIKYLGLAPLLLLLTVISTVAFSKDYAIDLFAKHPKNPETNLIEKRPTVRPIQKAIPVLSDKTKETVSQGHEDEKPEPVKMPEPRQAADLSPKKEPYAIWINAVTDTVKIRRIEKASPDVVDYNGIYIINEKIYTKKELKRAMGPAGELDIILEERPTLVVFSENDENAVAQWGRRAARGVIIVNPKKKTKP